MSSASPERSGVKPTISMSAGEADHRGPVKDRDRSAREITIRVVEHLQQVPLAEEIQVPVDGLDRGQQRRPGGDVAGLHRPPGERLATSHGLDPALDP
jgi:hypothetical protein